MLKLDFGCGEKKQDGFLGVDSAPDIGADIVHDLTVVPYPFEDASVDEIYSSHFFEHLTGKERIAFMQECWRIMKPNTHMTIITPYWTSMRAVQDPTHQWPPICETSYCYFNKQWRVANQLMHYNINCDFDFKIKYSVDNDVKQFDSDAQDFAFKHYTNAILDLHVILTKRPA